MTAIIKANIPGSITTLEQLAAWCCIGLAHLNPDELAVEGQNYAERIAQANPFFIQVAGTHRLLCRLSIELDPTYIIGGKKIWLYAKDFPSTLALPDYLKS